jgi:hypothetical protein
MSPPFSGPKDKPRKIYRMKRHMFPRNVGLISTDYMVLCPKQTEFIIVYSAYLYNRMQWVMILLEVLHAFLLELNSVFVYESENFFG